MTKTIKNFSDFRKVDEGYEDILGGLASSASTAFTDVIKNKITAYMLEFFGANPDSIMGTIIKNFAETIYVSDLYDWIVKGEGDVSVKNLAPRLADVTFETLFELGPDGIAQRLKIDKKGWIYSTIKEMLLNSAKKGEFIDHLLSFWTWVLTSMSGGESKSVFGTAKNGQRSTLRIAEDPEVKKAAERSGIDMASILRNLSSGATNPSGQMTPVGGQ